MRWAALSLVIITTYNIFINILIALIPDNRTVSHCNFKWNFCRATKVKSKAAPCLRSSWSSWGGPQGAVADKEGIRFENLEVSSLIFADDMILHMSSLTDMMLFYF